MRNGMSLVEMANVLARQQEAKKDYTGPSRAMSMVPVPDQNEVAITFNVHDSGAYIPSDICHRQIGTFTGIPAQYYDRMRKEKPELLARNVTTWMRESDDARMLRTFEWYDEDRKNIVARDARAFLSGRYRPLDNAELFAAVFPLLQEDGIQVVSCDVTDTRFYVQAVNPRLETEVRKGDAVQAGICLRNSEVGHGALAIEPLVFRLVCLNGMISKDNTLRKFHVGGGRKGQVDEESGFYAYLSDDTRRVSDAALWMQVRDLTKAAMKEALFTQMVDRLREATEQVIDRPAEMIEVTSKRFGFTEAEQGSILHALIEGKDLTRYGLAQAITNHANNAITYDRAYDLEKFGGEIIELNQREWTTIVRETEKVAVAA